MKEWILSIEVAALVLFKLVLFLLQKIFFDVFALVVPNFVDIIYFFGSILGQVKVMVQFFHHFSLYRVFELVLRQTHQIRLFVGW